MIHQHRGQPNYHLEASRYVAGAIRGEGELRPLRILVIEDDEDDYFLTADLLARGKRNRYEVEWASTYEAGLAAIQDQLWDVCLLDYRLGARTGVEFLREIQERPGIPPTILLSGMDDATIDEQVLHFGAADYLVKGQVTQSALEHSIRYVHERHRAFLVRLESEEVLRATLDALTSHLVILDSTGSIIKTNAAWNQFGVENGFTHPDFGVGVNYLDVCRDALARGDESVRELLTHIEMVLAGSERAFSMEYPCSSPGEERWFTVKVLPWGGARGTGAVIAHENVTARMLAVRELAIGERRFRTLIENSADHLFLLDKDSRTSYISPLATQRLGYTREDSPGYDFFNLVHTEDVASMRLSLAQVLAHPTASVTTEQRARHKDKKQVIWWECVLTNRLHDPDLGAIVINSRDITERKRAEAELRDSDSRYRELFDSATDLIYSIDLNGNILSLNPAAERAFGYAAGAAVGQPFRDLVGPEDHAVAERMLLEKLNGGSPNVVHELRMLSRTRRSLLVEMNTTVLYKEGSPAGVLGIGRDITQRRRSERFEQERRRILERVAKHSTLRDTITQIGSLVEAQYPGSTCVFHLPEEVSALLASEMSQSADECTRYFSQLSQISDDSPSTLTALRGEQILVEDIEAGWMPGPWRTAMLERGFKACWATPLLSAVGCALGALEICLPEVGPPRNGDGTSEKAAQLAALTIEHRLHTDQLAYQAQHDSLTGLPNRSLFHNRLLDAIEDANTSGSHAAVLYLDLDNFKRVNDSFGHHSGDVLLVQVIERLRRRMQQGDTLARLGGDEFAILRPRLSGRTEGKTAARDVLESLREPFVIDGQEVVITASVGLSIYPEDGRAADALLQNADTAMYGVKTRGKNAFSSYSNNIAREGRRRTVLQGDLHRALDRNEFHLAYQSQIDVKTGRLVGFEVLLRWEHRDGPVPPSTFIPLAEDSGLIVPIGKWVLEQVCRQGVQWQKSGCDPVRLAVNVSSLQFSRRNWHREVSEALVLSGFSPALLELELTETLVMRNVRDSVRTMNALRSMGVGISIDDFGTGYSSLAYLQRLPIDRLKIDLSFIQAIRADRADAPLIRAIISLAHTLGIRVVAEGVETPHQFAVLRELLCDEVQGYLFSRPVSGDDATAILHRARADRLESRDWMKKEQRIPEHAVRTSRAPRAHDTGTSR